MLSLINSNSRSSFYPLLFIRLCSLQSRFNIILAIITSTISVFAELLSLLSIVPLINSLSGSESQISSKFSIFQFLYYNGSLNPYSCIVFFVIITCLNSFFKLLSLYLNSRAIASLCTDVTELSLNNILFNPIASLPSRSGALDSREYIRLLTQDIDTLSISIRFTFQLFTSFFSFLLLTLFSIVVSPFASTISIGILTTCYFILISTTKTKLLNISHLTKTDRTYYIQLISDLLKDRKGHFLSQSISDSPLSNIKIISERIRSNEALSSFLSNFSRPLLETSGILTLLLVFLLLFFQHRSLHSIFPTIALLIVLFYKLLPLSQQVFSSLSVLRTHRSTLMALYDFVKYKFSLQNCYRTYHEDSSDFIILEDVRFKPHYPGSKLITYPRNINIKYGQKYCITGPSGSGKSTLVDIITGFQKPQSGVCFINTKHIDPFVSDIQVSPSHIFEVVSQHQSIPNIRLLDYITAAGQNLNPINYDRLHLLFIGLRLDTFIESIHSLQDITSGEDASYFSGGEAQRLALARAIYSIKPVIVLDEPTSRLDKELEADIFRFLTSPLISQTLILVTHSTQANSYFENNIRLSL